MDGHVFKLGTVHAVDASRGLVRFKVVDDMGEPMLTPWMPWKAHGQALLRAHLIWHGDCIFGASWWPKTRRQHEAAIAALIGSGSVSVPRLRLASVKPKQRGEQAAAGGRDVHGAAPVGASGDEALSAPPAPRESRAVFPLTEGWP
jgi:hypothetical protein